MQSQLQITLQDVPHSAALDERIREKVGRLEKMFPRLTACRVVISAPHVGLAPANQQADNQPDPGGHAYRDPRLCTHVAVS